MSLGLGLRVIELRGFILGLRVVGFGGFRILGLQGLGKWWCRIKSGSFAECEMQ